MRSPQRNWKRGRKWVLPDREWLEDQYITQDKSTSQIAKEIEVSPTTFRRWLRAAGIEIRKRGGSKGFFSGENNPMWKGGKHAYWGQRTREAAQELEIPEVCDRCGATRNLHVHHKNRNRSDLRPQNLQRLCNSCHMSIHMKENRLIIGLLRESEEFRRIVESFGIDPDHFWRGKE